MSDLQDTCLVFIVWSGLLGFAAGYLVSRFIFGERNRR